MSNCGAGECSCECGGSKGCGCIASSNSPEICECHCYGASIGVGATLGLKATALVDVSISGLPLSEVAKFLNAVHSERVLVPADLLKKMNRRVHLKAKRIRFSDVLKRLDLASSGQAKTKRKLKRK
jgi:hypothetical protein